MTADKPEEGNALHKTIFNNPGFASVYKTAEDMTGTYALDMLQQMDLASYTEPVNFLDLACGTGIVTKHAVDILGSTNSTTKPLSEGYFTFADFAPPMLNALKSRLQEETWPIHDGQMKIVEADMRDTKLPANTYTHLGCNFGPCNAANPERVFRESYRILKAGGVGGWTAWQTIGWLPEMTKAFDDIRSTAAQKCANGEATEQDRKLSNLPAVSQGHELMARLAGVDFSKLREEGVQESDLPRWDHEDYLKSQVEAAGFSDLKLQVVQRDFAISAEQCGPIVAQMVGLLSAFWSPEEKKAMNGINVIEVFKSWWAKRFEQDDVQDGKITWTDFRAMVVTGRKLEKD